jgi:hypothetical protein
MRVVSLWLCYILIHWGPNVGVPQGTPTRFFRCTTKSGPLELNALALLEPLKLEKDSQSWNVKLLMRDMVRNEKTKVQVIQICENFRMKQTHQLYQIASLLFQVKLRQE